MGQLRVYLPPFGPDYSGACSLLYPYRSLIVIHDANGCTSNYTSYDEPRWYGSRKAVFCSALRKIDVAIGNEEKFIDRIAQAAADLKPDFIALVGSPVPLVMGTDFPGMAAEIEARTGLVTLGLPTDGTGQYQTGIAMAGIALMDRFLPEDRDLKRKSLNILGATPMDFTPPLLKSLIGDLRDRGWEVLSCMSEEGLPLDLPAMRQAEVSLALGEGGIALARWLEKYYDIPWLAAFPVGDQEIDRLVCYLEQLAERKIESGHLPYEAHSSGDLKGLVIHEPVVARSIAIALERASCRLSVTPVSPFNLMAKDKAPQVTYCPQEKDLLELLQSDFDFVIADPLLLQLIPETHPGIRLPLGHFAISSRFSQGHAWTDRQNKFISDILERLFV